MGSGPEKLLLCFFLAVKEGRNRGFLWVITEIFKGNLVQLEVVLLYNTLNFYAEGQAYVDRGRMEGL